ncbi:unnamed protein product [Periconia digitata]|uniref:Uncharacterized protein n=1 Tax=Periconia digitata TaxID=1303443 RepID=A0A9W4UMM8_9PLEO|nr:unnamed protein product [Periconia digitata]
MSFVVHCMPQPSHWVYNQFYFFNSIASCIGLRHRTTRPSSHRSQTRTHVGAQRRPPDKWRTIDDGRKKTGS